MGIAKSTGAKDFLSDVYVSLTDRSSGRSIPHRVAVTLTHPNFGGARPWFVCPRCKRRAGKLYVPTIGVLGCRVCLKLVYERQYRKDGLTWLLRNFWK